MSSKSKQRSRRLTTGRLLQQAQRHYRKRQFRQALKDVRVCFRKQSSEENRSFYELSLFARADELCRDSLHRQCRTVVHELQELGVTDESVRTGLPELLLRAGLSDRQQSAGTRELTASERTRIRASMADEALVNPKSVPATETEILGGARAIRDALAAVESGDVTSAAAKWKSLESVPDLLPAWESFARNRVKRHPARSQARAHRRTAGPEPRGTGMHSRRIPDHGIPSRRTARPSTRLQQSHAGRVLQALSGRRRELPRPAPVRPIRHR